MAKKIAQVDAQAMDSLYASELTRMGSKVAAADDEKGAPHDPQAFKDHAEYIETMKSVLAEDAKTDFEPNDTIKD